MNKKKITLKAEGLVGGYGGMNILNSIDIEITQGEIVSIIGPNGAGKTTLLKSIFGLIELKKGNIFLGEVEVTNQSPQNMVMSGLSYVPQERNIFPTLTVKENLDMGAYLRENNLKESMESIFSLYPVLNEKRNQAAGELSGGQQQMLAISRGLMSDPQFLLLDEPTAGLSPKLFDETFDSILKIKELGIGILIVEQNAKKSLKISNRGYVLVAGENRLTGTGESLLINKEVANLFLGGQ
ncbi:ABC transporter ATP-binding protein [Bacteriovoracales bacterium]|nr:ABC transporter ATP-binding protein [Bacteriovoracales bacterium]